MTSSVDIESRATAIRGDFTVALWVKFTPQFGAHNFILGQRFSIKLLLFYIFIYLLIFCFSKCESSSNWAITYDESKNLKFSYGNNFFISSSFPDSWLDNFNRICNDYIIYLFY